MHGEEEEAGKELLLLHHHQVEVDPTMTVATVTCLTLTSKLLQLVQVDRKLSGFLVNRAILGFFLLSSAECKFFFFFSI